MAKILVTGGTGYIGSHTSVVFLEAGYDVVIVDNLSNSSIEVLDGIEQITGKKPLFYLVDLADRKETAKFFEQNKDIDLIVHFAAYKAVGESVANPLKYYRNNIDSLINVLDNMLKISTKGLVFSSSCTVYGQPDELPVTEKSPVKPAESPYGNTKKISEDIISDFVAANEQIKAIALRYFNPIGAHPTALIGELPLGVPNNLIPYLTQSVAGIRPPLKVFGNDYNTPDGTAIRDYIHVMDLAKAHLAAAERILNRKTKQNFEVFNVGTGRGYSVLEIIKLFEKATGLKVDYEITDRRPGDIEKVWADTSLANNELGWKAELSIEEALRSAWQWQKKQKK